MFKFHGLMLYEMINQHSTLSFEVGWGRAGMIVVLARLVVRGGVVMRVSQGGAVNNNHSIICSSLLSCHYYRIYWKPLMSNLIKKKKYAIIIYLS